MDLYGNWWNANLRGKLEKKKQRREREELANRIKDMILTFRQVNKIVEREGDIYYVSNGDE